MSKDISELCIWHKNGAIPEKNAMYEKCVMQCDGYNTQCIVYAPREQYFRRLAHKLAEDERNKKNW